MVGEGCFSQTPFMGVEPKIRGTVPPNHPFVHRVFHYFHHPFLGPSPIFGNIHLCGGLVFSLTNLLPMVGLNLPVIFRSLGTNTLRLEPCIMGEMILCFFFKDHQVIKMNTKKSGW